MKKFLLSILLIVFLIPVLVFAETCENDKVSIELIGVNSTTGAAIEKREAKITGNSLDLDLKMSAVGDSIEYKMKINNNSSSDYEIDNTSFGNSTDTIEYSVETEDNSTIIKSGKSKDVLLKVEYKNEVPEESFVNGAYIDNKSIQINLSADGTGAVSNPKTGVESYILLLTLILIVSTMFYLYLGKKGYATLVILICMLMIPISVYAVCKVDIEVESTIEIEKINKIPELMAAMSNEEGSCIFKYEGPVTDEVGKTVPATRVYFNRCPDQRNLIFGGYCWHAIRTTETGGLKILYNGVPVDGKCESNRPDHKVINQPAIGENLNLSGEFVYGDAYTINENDNTFTLVNTFNASWTQNTYEPLLGKFTCKSSETTCSTLYQVNTYISYNSARVSAYEVAPLKYSVIGRSDINANESSMAMVGYMFNTVYNTVEKYLTTGINHTYSYGSSFKYYEENETYQLVDTVDITDWRNGHGPVDTHHYTCWNTTGECQTLSYIFYTNGNYAIHLNLTGGKDIDDILNEMLNAQDVNKYNSVIKNIIEIWYSQNLSNYTDKLENAIYCNNRVIRILNGYDPNGGNTTRNLYFMQDYARKSLECPVITDQFSTSNNKAKLKYPVALPEAEELYNLNSQTLQRANIGYWTMSPYSSSISMVDSFFVSEAGGLGSGHNRFLYGIRPMISLKGDNTFSSGTGSETDPWIIE